MTNLMLVFIKQNYDNFHMNIQFEIIYFFIMEFLKSKNLQYFVTVTDIILA